MRILPHRNVKLNIFTLLHKNVVVIVNSKVVQKIKEEKNASDGQASLRSLSWLSPVFELSSLYLVFLIHDNYFNCFSASTENMILPAATLAKNTKIDKTFYIYVDYSRIPILQDRISSLKFLRKTLETKRGC